MTPFLVICASILGDLFLIWKLAQVYNKYNTINKNGVSVSGEIIDYHVEEGKNGKTYYPIVKFKTFSGEIFTQKAHFGIQYNQYLKQEKEVTLKYLEYNPKDFIIEGKNPTRNIPYIMVLLVVFVPIVIYLTLSNRPDLLIELKEFLD